MVCPYSFLSSIDVIMEIQHTLNFVDVEYSRSQTIWLTVLVNDWPVSLHECTKACLYTSLLPKSVCTAEVVCCSPFELRFVRKVCLNFTAIAHILVPFPYRGEPLCIIHAVRDWVCHCFSPHPLRVLFCHVLCVIPSSRLEFVSLPVSPSF